MKWDTSQWHVLMNPGFLTGRLTLEGKTLVFWAEEVGYDQIGYDVDLNAVNFDVRPFLNERVRVTTHMIKAAGMIAPHLGAVLVSNIRKAE